MSFLISSAQAAEPAAGAMDPGIFNILFLVGFGLIFYFFMWRPQAKRAKDHKNLINGLAKGDEVLTAGGIIGKVAKVVDDNEVLIETGEGTKLRLMRNSVSEVRSKGEPAKTDS